MAHRTNQSDSFYQNLAGLLLAAGIRQWMRTLDYKVVYHDPRTDPMRTRPHEQRYVYIFWHEYILAPLYLRGHCDLCMLLSPHRDGQVLARVARHMGFSVVRGSSFCRRVGGLKEMLHVGSDRHLCLTPDGPRGPRRRLSLGAIYMASRLQVPLVCVGWGLDQPWRLSSWDRFAIPRPFSRARCVMAEPISIPPGLTTETKEYFRGIVEQTLSQVTECAEEWAQSHASLPEQCSTRRESRSLASVGSDRWRILRPTHRPPVLGQGLHSRSA